MKNLLTAALLAVGLSGCGLLLRSQISVFHQMPHESAGITYAMVPFKDQEGSLEHKAYEESVRQELNAKGFRETAVEQALLVVVLSYGIDTGKEVVSSYIRSSARREFHLVQPTAPCKAIAVWAPTLGLQRTHPRMV